MFFWLLIVTLVFCTGLFKFKRRKLYGMASKFPHFKGTLPIIGIAHKLIGNMEDVINVLKQFLNEVMETGNTMGGWVCHLFFVSTLNPVDIEMLLKTCMEKDDLYRFMRVVLGNGGIFAPVSLWRPRRKIIMPAFAQKIVDGFVEVFSEQSQILTRRLSKMSTSEAFDIWPFITDYSMNSVCETALGVKELSNSHFMNCLGQIMHVTSARIAHVWWHPDWLFKFHPEYAEYKQNIKTIYDFTDKVISKKKAELLSKQGQPEANSYDLDIYQRQSFLELLINSPKSKFTDLELREETLTMIIAGTDTSSCGISFTLLLLGKYPEIQEKVYNELYEVFGDSERPLVKEDLPKLNYLERALKESMRLFPPVPFIVRKTGADNVTLPSGPTIPPGTGILVSIFALHRDPKYWGPDADHYDPDRFLPERFNLQHACSYMPFSNGPRNCVGYQYAMMSMKTLLATLLRSYKVICEPENNPIPHIRVKYDIMMKAVEGYKVSLERRPGTTMKA